MSRAFTKEPDGSEPVDDLVELPVSEARNLVTSRGLSLIDAQIARLRVALEEARKSGNKNAEAAAARDLRYWTTRRATAELIDTPTDTATMRFGLTATLQDEDGKEICYSIVGQDEADAAKGLLSYTAPLARQLIGKSIGETIKTPKGDMEIVAIE